jgi:hypothetical protein
MKKLIVFAVLSALLLSLGGFSAAAELPEGVGFTQGQYAGGDPEQYSTLGDIDVDWIPALDGAIDVTDGDLADWYASGAKGSVVTLNNMVSWVGEPADWKMTAFYAADSEYLYFAFDVIDPDFTYGTTVSSYNGDAIQLCLDFGYKIGEIAEEDPHMISSLKNIFYSFTCIEDGAPLGIMRQESHMDGILYQSKGDAVMGAARKTPDGWSVELALGWDLLYDDYIWKAWQEDPRVFVGASQQIPLSMGMCIYYINRTDTETITWAAGTVKGWTDDAGNPCVSWSALDNGAKLNLAADYAMQVNCKGVVGVFEHVSMEEVLTNEDGSPRDEMPDAPIEIESMPPVWIETPAVDPVPQDTLEDELQAILEKYGCTSALGMSSLTALLALAAAAYAIRKRK